MRTSESTAKIGPALVEALFLLENPSKTAKVDTGKFRYTFAPLPDIVAQIKPHLYAAGLTLLQEACSEPETNRAGCRTRIMHSSGEWIEYDPLYLPAGEDARSAGSAITYARRYQLTAALGIAADDDDDGAKARSVSRGAPNSVSATVSSDQPGSDGKAHPADRATCEHPKFVLLKADGKKLPRGYERCTECDYVRKIPAEGEQPTLEVEA